MTEERINEAEIYDEVLKADELCYLGLCEEETIDGAIDENLFTEVQESCTKCKNSYPYLEKETNKIVLAKFIIENQAVQQTTIIRYSNVSPEALAKVRKLDKDTNGYKICSTLNVFTIIFFVMFGIYSLAMLFIYLFNISNETASFSFSGLISVVAYDLLFYGVVSLGLKHIIKLIINKN